jgi:hypothetical protein
MALPRKLFQWRPIRQRDRLRDQLVSTLKMWTTPRRRLIAPTLAIFTDTLFASLDEYSNATANGLNA